MNRRVKLKCHYFIDSMEKGSVHKVKMFQGNIISEAKWERLKEKTLNNSAHEGNGNTTSFSLTSLFFFS